MDLGLLKTKSASNKAFKRFYQSRHGFSLSCAFLCLLSSYSAFAAATSGPQTITLDGKLTDTAGTNPLLDPSVVIDVKIYNPTATCILYEEHQTVDTTASEGRFTLLVGSVTTASKRVSGIDPGNPMVTVFSNQGAIAGSSCTYTPVTGDTRLMRVTVSPSSTGTVEQLSPDTLIDSVPFALMAESLQGLDRDHVLAIDSTTTLNQANVANVFSSSNYPLLTALLGGSGGGYVTAPASGGAKIPSVNGTPSSPVAGQIWFNSSANAFQYYNGIAVQTLGVAGSGIASLNVGSSLTSNGVASTAVASGATLDLVNSGVAAGSYSKVTVNTKGVVTYGTGLTESDIPTLLTPGHVIGNAITSGTIGGSTNFYSSGNVTAQMMSSGIDLTRQIQLFDPAVGSTHKITISAPTLASDYSLVFPSTAGSFGYALTTDGSGNLSWANVASNTLPSLTAGKIWVGNSSNVATAVTPFGDVTLSIAGSATVTGLQGYPVSTTPPTLSGQILRWNGSAWTPNSLAMSDLRSTVTGTSALTSCTAAQTLVFNSVTDSLLCSNISIASNQVGWGSTGANLVFAGPATGSAGSPTFRTLTAADLPAGATSQWNTASTTINYVLGAVGVGTAVPQAVLDVYGSGASSAMLVPRDSTSARPTGINGMLRYNTVTNAMETYANGAWSSVATGANGASQWTTSGSNIYYNASSGNVGVGTNTPAVKLHVVGDYLTNGKISIGSSAYADFNILSNGTIYQNGGDPFTRIQSGGSGNPRLLLQTNGPSASATDANHEIGRIDYGGYSGSVWYDQTASIKAVSESAFTSTSAPTAITFSTTQASSNSVLERARVSGNGNFGIGTTSPQAELDVYGTGGSSAMLVPRDTTLARPAGINGMLRYNTTNAQLETYSSGAWAGLATGATGASQWITAGANIYYSTGKVGIGTNGPGSALDVVGNINTSGYLSLRSYSILTSPNNDNSNVGVGIGVGGAWTGGYDTALGANSLGSNTSGAQNVAVGANALAVNISGSQNVALGTQAMAFGTGSGNTAVGSQAMYNGTGTQNVTLGYQSGMDLTSGSNNLILGTYPSSGAGITTGSSNILIGQDVRPASQTGSNQLNIGNLIFAKNLGTGATPSTGSVGIGTSMPQAFLDVNGSGTANSAMLVPRDSTTARPTGINGMLRYNTTNAQLETYSSGAWAGLATGASGGGASQWTTSGSNIYYNASSGNVGIGTSGPGYKLHIADAANTTLQIQATTSGVRGGFSADTPSTNAFYSGSYANFPYVLGVNNAEKMRIDTSGNVGIGTTGPTGNLDILASTRSADTEFRIGGSAMHSVQLPGYSGLFLGSNSDGNGAQVISTLPSWFLDLGGRNTGAHPTDADSFTVRRSASGSNDSSSNLLLQITNQGNVGVGTTSPQALLDVYGTGAASAMIVPRDSTINRPTTGINGMLRYNMTLGKLEAFTSSNWQTIDSSSGANGAFVNNGNAFGAAAVLGTTDSNSLALVTGNSTRLTISSSGNVGVGNTSPSSLLQVTGPNRINAVFDGTQTVTDSSNQNTLLIASTFAPTSTTTNSIDLSIFPTMSPPSGITITNGIGQRIQSGAQSGSGSVTNGYGLWVDAPSYGSNKYAAYFGGNVGIGTTAPSFQLTNSVLTNVSDQQPLGLGGSGSFVWEHLATNSNVGYAAAIVNSYSTAVASGLLIKTADATPGTRVLTANSGGNDRFVVRGDGTVGVGTTAPGAMLHSFAGSQSVLGLLVGNSTYSTSALNGLGLQVTNAGSAILRSGWATSQPLVINDNGGFVGIGTAAPQALLDIYGTTTANSAMIVPRATVANRPTVNVNGMIRYATDTNALESYINGAWTNLSTAASGGSQWTTSGSNIYYGSGNVGIGTTNPANTLGVSGNVGLQSGGYLTFSSSAAGPSNYALYGDTTQTNLNAPSSGAIGFNISNIRAATISSTGNFGIGTSNPSAQFHMKSASGSDAALFVDNSSNSNWSYVGFGQNGVGNAYVGLGGTSYGYFGGNSALNIWNQASGGAVSFGTSSGAASEKMRIAANGYVGIGLSNPAYPVDVFHAGGSNPTSAVLNLVQTSTGGLGTDDNTLIRFTHSNGSNGRTWFSGTGSNTYFGSPDNFGFYDYSAGAARFVINTAGYVGIGTISPSFALDINGTVNSETGHFSATTAGGGALVLDSGPTGGIRFRSDNTLGNINSYNELMFINSGGSVGIGTVSPSQKLHVYSSGNIFLNVDSGSVGNATQIMFSRGASNGSYVGPSAGNTFDIATVESNPIPITFGINGEKMRIATSGNVGIGTSAPSYTLHVVGTAGLSTGTAWTNASDIRLKDIHGDYEYGLDQILRLHTVRYSYKKDNALGIPSDHPMTGIIAQEVQKVIPDAINVRKDGYLELNIDPIHWAVVNAIKEFYHRWYDDSRDIHKEIETLRADNAAKTRENAELKAYLCSKDPSAAFCVH